MTRRAGALLSFALSLGNLSLAQTPVPTPQPLENYAGRFINWDGRLLTALDIQMRGSSAVLHAWGKCGQRDCDWGTTEADVYRLGAPQAPGGGTLSCVYVRDSVEYRLILQMMNSGQLVVDVLARFIDDPSRNASHVLFFEREGKRSGGPYRLVPAPAGQRPVRVGGAISEPVRVKDVRPVYPDAAKANRLQGLIVLECTIGPDGSVVEARPLRGEHQILIDAAIETVKQWRYTPTLVNGVAVPVIMTVTVNYKLS